MNSRPTFSKHHKQVMADKLKPPVARVSLGKVFCEIIGANVYVCRMVEQCKVLKCKAKRKIIK